MTVVDKVKLIEKKGQEIRALLEGMANDAMKGAEYERWYQAKMHFAMWLFEPFAAMHAACGLGPVEIEKAEDTEKGDPVKA